MYICKVEGPDKGPKYDWPCDYIDAWPNSAVYDPEILDDSGKMIETLEVAEAVRKKKWARFDIVDQRKWREMGRDDRYIKNMKEIKEKSREAQLEELREEY